jgi:UDP-N-acetylmuramate dehydrogenase
MLKIKEKVALAPFTTLKIGGEADFFAIVKSYTDIIEAIAWAREHKQPIYILGGGSNVLISGPVKGLVIKNEIKGSEISEKTDDYVLVTGFSGETWSRFVKFTTDHDLYGLENLFLIYGTVGAAPVQNIGAYGVELKDVFYHLKAIDLKTGHEKIFATQDCQFGYRDSIFKKRLKGRYFIYSVTVKLSRQPNFKLDYGSIREELNKKGIADPRLIDVVRTIEEIRNNKLPNPAVLPNAGSFFKNAEISRAQFNKLAKKYPDMPSFPVGRTKVKIPTGWLIEQAGFKGRKVGPVRMYEKQALIMVNHGQAEAKHALALVKKIKAAVKKMFAIDLEEEVNII